MQQVPREMCEGFERRLEGARIPELQRPGYRKWLRFYIDFCHKYGHSPTSASSLGPFLSKLASKNQSVENRNQAALAVRLQLAAARGPGSTALGLAGEVMPGDGATQSGRARVAPSAVDEQTREPGNASALEASFTQSRTAGEPRTTGWVTGSPPHPPATGSAAGRPGVSGVSALAPGRRSSWEREYRDLEGAIRLRNYSGKTLEAYRLWVRKFQGFVRSRPTGELGTEEVRGFLTDLAVRQGVAASTQNQAFNALLFFYRHVLGREFGKLDGVVRAKRHRYVPVVLSRSEVEAVLGHLQPPYRLVGLLLYGCGLRLAECVGLRVHCFNFDAMLLTVHDGKGQKDRTVPLPARALPEIRQQMDTIRRLHAEDLVAGYAGVFLPRQLEKKYRNAAREFIWQWFFPAANLTFIPAQREQRRYHLHDSHVQGAVKQAAARAGMMKRVSPHTFRHTFASHLLLANYDLQTIQRLLGHTDVRTTMIYLQTVPSVTLREAKSPLDLDTTGVRS